VASRGWEHVRPADLRDRRSPSPSKFHNVKVKIDGETFDSKREGDYWRLLQARLAAGEISDLRRQVRFGLFCPTVDGSAAQVAEYVADFTFVEHDVLHVIDVKGVRTPLFKLKSKWLRLQQSICVEEV